MLPLLAIKPFIMPILLGGTLIVGGLYIKAKIEDIVTLKENNAKLLQATEQQKMALEAKENDFESIVAAYEEQQRINKTLEKGMEDLRNKFNQKKSGEERKFGELLIKRAEWMEKIINKGTQKVFECFEQISRNENNNCDNTVNNP